MWNVWGLFMKYFKKISWVVLFLFLALCVYVVVKFQVDDMTLSKGEVYEFDEGWTFTGEDGKTVLVETLPFSGNSKPEEKVCIENSIPKEFWGMSMSFLSADKRFTVFIDGEKVYEFGMNDKRSFGRTPGSVVNSDKSAARSSAVEAMLISACAWALTV